MLAAAVVGGGCLSDVSRREAGGETQGAYLNQLLANADPREFSQDRVAFAVPAGVAVAQVGELAPPQPMMMRLREHDALFRRAVAIPAVDGVRWRYGEPQAAPQNDIRSLRTMAGSLGMDYLLLVGGTVDQIESATPLSLFNLSIVGAFIVPSHRTTTTLKSSGALIDVRTGRVVAISSAEARDEQLRPLVSAGGDMDRRLSAMRDEVAVALADAVAADCQKIGGAILPATAVTPTSESPGTTAPEGIAPVSKRTFQGR